MRYASALAIAVAAIFMISAVPFLASSDSYAEEYVSSTEKLNISGCVTGFDTAAPPKVYIFVVHTAIEEGRTVYQYINLNDDPTDTSLISSDIINNTFNFVVPRITSANAEYYLFFENHSLTNVPWTGSIYNDLKPDKTTWTDPPTKEYPSALQVPRDTWSSWSSYDPADPTTLHWLSDKKPENQGVFTLQRSAGDVSGHVSIVVRGDPRGLGDVRVEFYSNGRQIRYINTDDGGDFSIEDLPTGEYEVKFYRGNYYHDPITVNVIQGKNTIPEVTMELEMDNSYFGYDLVHFLMFIGAGLCILMIIISTGFQYKRMKGKKTGREWILDDMPEEEDDE